MAPSTGPTSVLAALLRRPVERLRRGPGSKRNHLFETDDGNRATPFGSVADGAARWPGTCRGCGRGLESRAYWYCPRCAAPPGAG